jgi:hypothetical protein
MEMVNVGCRLPNGVTLEIGYTASVKGQGRGAPFARYSKNPDYQSFTIKGANQHLLVRDPSTRKIVTTLPARRTSQPFINQVPKEFWDRWNKEHPASWYLASGQLYVIPKTDAETVEAVTIDAQAKSDPIFRPLDPMQVVDLDGAKIEKRTDE